MEFRAKLIFLLIWLLYIVAEAVANVRGVAGIDYPNYSTIPKTSFKCSEQKKIPGFYADLETDCQVFHHCYKHRQESYLCAPGTVFNQALQTCDYWYSTTCKSPTSAIEGEKQEYKDEPLIPVAKKSSPFTVYEKMAALYEPHNELNSNFKQELQFDEVFQDFPKLPSQNKISESEALTFTGMNTNKGSFKEYSERRMLNSLNPVEYQHEIDISSDQEEDKSKDNFYSITIKQNESAGEFQNDMFENLRNYINDDTSKERDSFVVLDKESSSRHLKQNAKDLPGEQSSGVETTVKKRKLRRKPTYVILQTETDERSLNENLDSVNENKENSQILYDPNYKHDKIQLDTDSSKIVTDVMPITNTPKRNRKPINTLSTENKKTSSVSDVQNSVILDNIMTASLDDAPSVTETVNYKRRRPILVGDVSDKPQDLAVENSGDNITTEESMHIELNSENFSEDELNLLFDLLENFDGNQKVEPSETEDLTQIKITGTNENNITTESQLNFESENENKKVTELLNFDDSDLNTNVKLNTNVDSEPNKNLGNSFGNLEEAEISSVVNFTSGDSENSSLKHDIYLKTADGQRNSQTDFDDSDADNNDLNLTSNDQNGVISHALEETGVMYENQAENFNDGHWILSSGNEHSDYENTEVNIINNDSPNFSFVDSEEPHSLNEQSTDSYDINNDRPDQVTYKTTEYINNEMVASGEGNKEFTTKTDEPDTTEEILDELSDVNDFDEENQEYTTIIYEYELEEEVSDEVRHMTEFEEENQIFTTIIYESDLATAISDEPDLANSISDEPDLATAISDELDLATAISDELDLATAISDESVTMANDKGIQPETLENSGLSDIQSSSHKDEMLRIAGYNSGKTENFDAEETNVDAQELNYRNLNSDFSFINEEEDNNKNFENIIRNFDSDLSHLDKVSLKEKFAEIERETFIPVSPISSVVESQMGPASIQPVLRTLNEIEDGNFKENSVNWGDAEKNSNFLGISKSFDFTNIPKDHQNSFVVSEKNQHIKSDKISDLNESFIEESVGITETVQTPDLTDASNEIDSVKEHKPNNFDAKTKEVPSLQTNINNPQTIHLNSVDDNSIFFKESDIPQNSVFPPNSMALPTNAYERNLYLQNLNQVQNKQNILLKNSNVFPTTFYRELSPGLKTENTRGDIQKITPKPNLASLKAGFLKLKKNYIEANMFSPKSSEDSGFMASFKPYHTAATAWFKKLPSIFPSFNDDNAFQARSGKIAKKSKKFKVPKIIKLINFGRRLLRMKKAKINMIKKFMGI